MSINMIPLDVNAGLESAEGQVMNFSKPAVNDVVVPLAAVAVGIVLLFFIVGAVNRHRGGDEYKDKIIGIIVCLVVLVLVLSFPTWGWTMIGQ